MLGPVPKVRFPVVDGWFVPSSGTKGPRCGYNLTVVNARTHRLPVQAYIGQTVAFTSCLKDRSRTLATDSTAKGLILMLEQANQTHHCTVPIYCIMPDHMYIVIRSSTCESNPKLAMDDFKWASSWWLYKHDRGLCWQRSYWDHIIHPDEDWAEQVRYIAENPCRAGLVKEISQWPYLGSIGHHLHDILVEGMF